MISKNKSMFFIILLFSLLTSCKQYNKSNTEINNKDVIVLRYAESSVKGSAYAKVSEYFAILVNKKSEGRINIKVYYNSQLGNEKQILTQLKFGGIAMGRVSLLSIAEEVPSLSPDFEYLITNNFENDINYINENKEHILFSIQGEKMSYLTILQPSIRCFYSDREFNLENLTSLKLGIDYGSEYEIYLRNQGFNPVIVGNADNYLSLRNGYMDIRESSLAELIASNEYPYIKQVVIFEDVLIPSLIIFSNEVMNQLSRDDNELIKNCANETMLYSQKLIKNSNKEIIEKLEKDEKLGYVYDSE